MTTRPARAASGFGLLGRYLVVRIRLPSGALERLDALSRREAARVVSEKTVLLLELLAEALAEGGGPEPPVQDRW